MSTFMGLNGRIKLQQEIMFSKCAQKILKWAKKGTRNALASFHKIQDKWSFVIYNNMLW